MLITFNALPHVFDAFHFLHKIFSLLEVGGILVLNDNIYWDNVYEALHPIKVRWPIWYEFLSAFEVLDGTIQDRECFFAPENSHPAAGLYGESGTIFVIARKISTQFPMEEMLKTL